jgi:hypothetical protein
MTNTNAGITFKHRTHDEARAALRDFCDVAWGNKARKDGSSINIFTIPKDEERDADCILYDVLRERDVMLEALYRITKARGVCGSSGEALSKIECWAREALEQYTVRQPDAPRNERE